MNDLYTLGGSAMNSEEKILDVLNKPLKNEEISNLTGLESGEVGKTLRKLRDRGQIISRGYTTARRHMRLATAIELIFSEVSNLKISLDVIENNLNLR